MNPANDNKDFGRFHYPKLIVASVVLLCILRVPLAVAQQPAQCGQKNYIDWLEAQSMFHQTSDVLSTLDRNWLQWKHPYAKPQPQEAVKSASVWVLGYAGAMITRQGESVIASWGDPELWDIFQELGIELLHTGPVNVAGGIRECHRTPSIDGWFDPISLDIDQRLGTEQEYRRMVEAAHAHHAQIAGDIVPLHTGKGPDFLLGLRAYKNYADTYVMAEIRKEDWPVLPTVEDVWDSKPVSRPAAELLTKKGYLPGLINSNDASAEAQKLSGWDSTAEITGADGKNRRWVYLHFFKPGQPTLNWAHPSNRAQTIIAGNVARSVGLGARILRLDAVPFLGIEPVPNSFMTWHYQHPLSIWGTNYLAFLTRRLGGWSFQELNVPLEQLKPFVKDGPDLSYDFFTRTETVHSLLTGDASVLRQAHRFLMQQGIPLGSLVHDLQNHDEITYQLVELDHRANEQFRVQGRIFTGRQLRNKILDEMRSGAAGSRAPYNILYRPQKDGVATTFAGFVAASLGITDPYHATPEQLAMIQRGHLLLAMANAMEPGIFSLSSWDLVGALPLPVSSVANLVADQDYRWINRGAIDLLDRNPRERQSFAGLPRAKTLYGPLQIQLRNPDSFASRLKEILRARRKYQIALGELIAIPRVTHSPVCVLVIKLPGDRSFAVTALNFGRRPVREEVDRSTLEKLTKVSLSQVNIVNAINGEVEPRIENGKGLTLTLNGISGKTLIIKP